MHLVVETTYVNFTLPKMKKKKACESVLYWLPAARYFSFTATSIATNMAHHR